MVQLTAGIFACRLGNESERIGSVAASAGNTNGGGFVAADTALYDGRGVVCRNRSAGATVRDN